MVRNDHQLRNNNHHSLCSCLYAPRDGFWEYIPNMQVISDNEFDTCYNMSSASIDVPSITFHLDCNVDLVFPEENILYQDTWGLICLAFFILAYCFLYSQLKNVLGLLD